MRNYVRKTHSYAELVAACSEAGRKGAAALAASGNRRGGRPYALRGMPVEQCSTVTVKQSDHEYLNRLATNLGISKAAAVRLMILWWRGTKGGVACNPETEEILDASVKGLAPYLGVQVEKTEES